jgi:hypothetical protein
VKRAIALLLLLLTLPSLARADDEKKDDKKDEPPKPYTEGWKGGSPPGERATVRADLWELALEQTKLQLGHLQPIRPVTSSDLGLPREGWAGGVGAEVYTGRTGWLSIDWWTTQTRFEAPIQRDFSIDETPFQQGSLAVSEVTQHIVKIRDGLDIRFRVPLGEETNLDFNFGPVSALLVRYESISVKVPNGPQQGDALVTVTLCPGWRAGIDLYLPESILLRIGSDVDLLPHLSHNWLSFTRAPSVDAWADARAFVAFRFQFLEVMGGWRYFRTLASGGHFRQAESDMRGPFVELAARF